jgi:hypothetical protein
MTDMICQGCGAIFTSETDQVPTGLMCSCQHTEFKIQAL